MSFRVTLALACTVASLAACDSDRDRARRYLTDRASRRETLERSLARTDNAYARTRLDRYARPDGLAWESLIEWNPRVEPVLSRELDTPPGVAPDAPLTPAAAALDVADTRALDGDPAALRALGARAFWRYPVQLFVRRTTALSSRAAAAHAGLWVDETAGVNGLVHAQMADGSTLVAMTCASCHVARDDRTAELRVGAPNARFDFGLVLAESAETPDDPLAAAARAWGPGRVDVSSRDGTEPVRVPDLRPVRWLTHLHASGAVVQRDVLALAVRIETLIITSHHDVLRPPRVVALALAEYLWSLADTLPAPPREPDERERRGARVFAERCAQCHAGEGLAGPLVAVDTVGTDPATARSPDRGTGSYRAPSLRGVATRGPLLHDGTVADLDAMLDRARLRPGYPRAMHGVPSIPGHTYGLELDDSARSDLIAWLRRQ